MTAIAATTAIRSSPHMRRGFTLAELVVVMAAIVILLSVSIPAFSALIESQNRSLAQTQLRVALAGARTLALQQTRGTDTAAVFTFEPGGRVTVISAVQVGSIRDTSTPGDPLRDVFVPSGTIQPNSLPQGWMARGLALPGTVAANRNNGWGPFGLTAPQRNQRSWVFPETGFYNQQEANAGRDRRTFMIRFEGATGTVSSVETDALVLLRRPTSVGRPPNSDSAELFRQEDPAVFLRRKLADPVFVANNAVNLIGDVSSDTVLTRPVRALALYRERDMANALGLTLNRTTGVLYQDDYQNGPRTVVDFRADQAFEWLETGDPRGETDFEDGTPGARLYSISRIDGRLIDLVESAEANR